MPADRRTWYVKRTRWRPCENGTRVATCYHVPRCAPMRRQGTPRTPGAAPFGRWVTGWTRVRGKAQAGREAKAWGDQGWSTLTLPTSPQVRAEVRAWERAAQGYPGEAGQPQPRR